ncbi:MAG: HAD family hydrolase [Clostridiales bacterium]|nr:HAD family hydrolase [Clostridiales bacterium]
MKTLYVSDLDGTLLHSDETLSPFTIQTINELVSKGILFSYATARSYVTASKATKGITAALPLIVYNGAMIIHNNTGEKLKFNRFADDVHNLLRDLLLHEVYPLVYSLREGRERFSYIPSRCSRGMNAFLSTREGDPRRNPVQGVEDLFQGEVFYITCIDENEKLLPLYRRHGAAYHTVYARDFYSGEQWLEFMPRETSKANAVHQLKEMYGCSRVVAFGDGTNDLDMFRMADECYAVENAAEELKRIATGVIPSNDKDGVAQWLKTIM